MQKEEEILNGYITGTSNGQDNKLRAAIGSLNAKRSKNLTDAIIDLRSTFSQSTSNLIINITHSTGEMKRGMDEQVNILNKGIENQVNNLIYSNEKLSESNERNSRKTHIFTIVNIILTLIIAGTGVIGLWNISLTNAIKDESIKANQISEQPFLNFIDEGEPFKIINSGKGVAVNILMLIWDKPQKQLRLLSENSVIEALGVDKNGRIDNTQFVITTLEDVKIKIPNISELLSIAQQKDTTWFALLYEDIYGKRFATLVRGAGGSYTEAVRFIRLDTK